MLKLSGTCRIRSFTYVGNENYHNATIYSSRILVSQIAYRRAYSSQIQKKKKWVLLTLVLLRKITVCLLLISFPLLSLISIASFITYLCFLLFTQFRVLPFLYSFMLLLNQLIWMLSLLIIMLMRYISIEGI
jgi:hypothetical protein